MKTYQALVVRREYATVTVEVDDLTPLDEVSTKVFQQAEFKGYGELDILELNVAPEV